jgi:phosphoribosylanthranilate isomerase
VTAVKICGLTRPEDATLAGELGATWVGFNFSAESPRRVSPETARRLASAAGDGVVRVGVFVSEVPALIREAVDAACLDLVQIHRRLTPEDPGAYGVPVVAVAHMGISAPKPPPAELLSKCKAVLFDVRVPGRSGGTGKRFDWSLVAGRQFGAPVLLAGGLDPGNVAEAIRRVRPWGVDVASGVETSPGVKDAQKMRRFFEAVRSADGAAA